MADHNTVYVSKTYAQQIRELLNKDKTAVVIIDNIKELITEALAELLDRHRIYTCLITANTYYLLPIAYTTNGHFSE